MASLESLLADLAEEQAFYEEMLPDFNRVKAEAEECPENEELMFRYKLGQWCMNFTIDIIESLKKQIAKNVCSN